MTESQPRPLDLNSLDSFVRMDQMLLAESDTELTDDRVMDLLVRLADVIGFTPDCSCVDPAALDALADATAYLHYSLHDRDWFITHRDRESQQWRAFGMIFEGGVRQLDFICIYELLRAGASINLDWRPTPLGQIELKNEAGLF